MRTMGGGAAVGMRARQADLPARTAQLAASLFDLSRGRQALLSIAQPGLAAVLAAGGLPGMRATAIGLAAAWAGFFAVFSLNDVLDRRVDAAALRAGEEIADGYDLDIAFLRHPLAQGELSLRVSLAWVVVLAAFATLGAWVLDPLCLLVFGVAAALEVLYCSLRQVTWAKTIVSGVMVGAGALAGWVAVAPLSWRAAPVAVFLGLWEIGGRNLANDLADLTADASVGIRTVATTFGARAAARANLLVAIPVVAVVGLLGLGPAALAGSLLCGLWLVVWPALWLAVEKTSSRAGWYFNRASLYPMAVLVCTLAASELGPGW